MDTSREIPFYPATQFADILANPRSYFGYAASAQEADEVVHQYEMHTSSKFVAINVSAGYGLPVLDILKKGHFFIRFRDKMREKSAATILPLRGLPFIMLGKKWKECEFGIHRPRTRDCLKKRQRQTKKIGCPTKVIIRDVLVFQKYRIDKDTKFKRKLMSDKVREELETGVVSGERRFYIDLPNPENHMGHTLGEEIRYLSKKKEKQLIAQQKAVMDLTFLGTFSCYPTPTRGVSSTVFRHDGECWMFDCGEGTQTQLMKSRLRAGAITKIFITHLHGDHLFGLPGLLCTTSNGTPPPTAAGGGGTHVELYGPVGLRRYLRVSLELSRSPLRFTYAVHELMAPDSDLPSDWEEWQPSHQADGPRHPQELEGKEIRMDPEDMSWHIYEDKKVTVKAAPLTHRIPCFGYVIEEKMKVGKLKAGYLKERGILPGPLYTRIKAGESIVSPSGEVISPAEAVGPSIPGRKIVILGDTKDSSRISQIAYDADVLVHEATMANEMTEKCLEVGHSTPAMAAAFAQSINAKNLVLFHVSQRFRPAGTETGPGEETVEILLRQASEAGYAGHVVLAEDLDVITIERKEGLVAAEMETETQVEMETAASSLDA